MREHDINIRLVEKIARYLPRTSREGRVEEGRHNPHVIISCAINVDYCAVLLMAFACERKER